MKEYTPKQRTDQQRKALEVFCKILAGTLNNAGLDQRKVLKPGISIPWTQKAVKDSLWRPIQEAMFNKHSTTELYKLEEIDKIHAVLMRELGKTFGLEYFDFPHTKTGEVDDEGRVYFSNDGN